MSSLLVFNTVYRLEIQSVMLVFSTPLVNWHPCSLLTGSSTPTLFYSRLRDRYLTGLCHEMNIFFSLIITNRYFLYLRLSFYNFLFHSWWKIKLTVPLMTTWNRLTSSDTCFMSGADMVLALVFYGSIPYLQAVMGRGRAWGQSWQLTRRGRRNTSRRFYPCCTTRRTSHSTGESRFEGLVWLLIKVIVPRDE